MEHDGRSSVKVVVRVRECTKLADAFSIGKDGKSITIRQSKTDLTDGKPKDEQELLQFACDTTLNNASQERAFDVIGKQATDAMLAGYNGTVLCYGQTGAGKSFTMVGSRDNYHQRGVAARAIAYAFREAANRPADEFIFRFSCLEIYNDQMYDLLSTLPSEGSARNELSLSEKRGKVEVKGLMNPEVESEEAALELLFEAESNRAVAQHQLNVHSSRSHVLYMLNCEKRSRVATGAVTTSRLTLVDLAGSERLKKSSAVGETGPDPASARQLAREAMSINKSLSFLEQVVVALASRKGHVPHRSSKLTAVLRESLGGNCKTLLVANVWPEARHMEETLSTLKFAARMQSVTNFAAINSQAEVSPAAALAACQTQLNDLKRELAMHDQLAGRAHISYDAYSAPQRIELRGRVQRFLDGELHELEATTLRQVKESFELFREIYQEQSGKLMDASKAAASAAQAYAQAPSMASGGAAAVASGGGEADAPPVEVVDYVGGEDGLSGGSSGFGCGVAPSNSRPSNPQYADRRVSAAAGIAPAASDPYPTVGVGALATPEPASQPTRPDYYYSDFKHGAGAELHALLLENKATLRQRRAAVRQHALGVNEAKHAIDDIKHQLDAKKMSKSAEKNMAEHNGVTAEVIDDEEFALIAKLKAAKGSYRAAYDQLTDERSTVEYVTSAVEQCRSQLVADYGKWMAVEHPEAAVSKAQLAAAAGNDLKSDSLSQPSSIPGPSFHTSYTSAVYSGSSSIYGSNAGLVMGLDGGYGGASGGGTRMLSGVNEESEMSREFDQEEQFEVMENQLAMQNGPESIPFFKASKLANAKGRKTNDKGASVRAKGKPGFVL